MPARRGELVRLLRQRIVSRLHLGLLHAGERLPSSRAVARGFQVDPRVAVAAYRIQEREGLVDLRARSGIYVAASAGEHGIPHTRLAAWAVEVFVQAIEMGMPAPQLSAQLQRCIDTLHLRALCIECNDDQLYSLCDELSQDYGLDTTALLLDELAEGKSGGEIQRADLLVTALPKHS